MREVSAALLALAAAAGALIAVSAPLWMVVVVVVAAWWRRSVALLAAAVLLAVSSRSSHAWRELDQPVPRSLHGVAFVAGQPIRIHDATRVQVVYDDRRYEMWMATSVFAAGGQGSPMQLEPGTQVQVAATTRALSGPRTPYLRRQHVAAVATASTVRVITRPTGIWSVAAGIRSSVEHSAMFMPPERRGLFTGLLYGDDRAVTDDTRQAFRQSGMSHLTAVSGANVAFVLLLIQAFVRRLRLGLRFAACGLVLLLFVTMTGFEPSVIRAGCMAAVFMAATWLGRPLSLFRCLAIAVVLSLLADPFLVGSLGFVLSVSACVAMAIGGARLAARCPGSPRVGQLVGFTAAAQIGTAPILLAVFGSVAPAGLVANVLAEPVAAFVMMWGLPAALAADVLHTVLGGPWGRLLLTPCDLAVHLLQTIARIGPAVSHDHIRAILVLAVPAAGLWSWRRRTVLLQAARADLIGPPDRPGPLDGDEGLLLRRVRSGP